MRTAYDEVHQRLARIQYQVKEIRDIEFPDAVDGDQDPIDNALDTIDHQLDIIRQISRWLTKDKEVKT